MISVDLNWIKFPYCQVIRIICATYPLSFFPLCRLSLPYHVCPKLAYHSAQRFRAWACIGNIEYLGLCHRFYPLVYLVPHLSRCQLESGCCQCSWLCRWYCRDVWVPIHPQSPSPAMWLQCAWIHLRNHYLNKLHFKDNVLCIFTIIQFHASSHGNIKAIIGAAQTLHLGNRHSV